MNALTTLKLEMLREELEESLREGTFSRLKTRFKSASAKADRKMDKVHKVGDHVAGFAAKHGGMVGKAASSLYHQQKAATHLGRALRHAALGQHKAAKSSLHKAASSLKTGIHHGLSAATHVK